MWSGRELVREGLRYLATVIRARVPRLTDYVPVRVNGREQVESVVLARIDRRGAVMPRSEREIACDVVAVNYGFAANSELAAMAGIAMRHDPPRGGWLPVVDEFGHTSVAGIFAAGDAAGLRGALVAEAEGQVIGAAAAADPEEIARAGFRAGLAAALATRKRLSVFQGAMQRLLRVPGGLWRLPTDETIICRCENVTLRRAARRFDGRTSRPEYDQAGHACRDGMVRRAHLSAGGLGACRGARRARRPR